MPQHDIAQLPTVSTESAPRRAVAEAALTPVIGLPSHVSHGPGPSQTLIATPMPLEPALAVGGLAAVSGVWSITSGVLSGWLLPMGALVLLAASLLWPLRQWSGCFTGPARASSRFQLVFLADGAVLLESAVEIRSLQIAAVWGGNRQVVIRLSSGPPNTPSWLKIERDKLADEAQWRFVRRWIERRRATVTAWTPQGGQTQRHGSAPVANRH